MYEEVESDTSDQYTGIPFNDEKQSDQKLLDFKTEFELFNENPSPKMKATQNEVRSFKKLKQIHLSSMIKSSLQKILSLIIQYLQKNHLTHQK